MDQLLSAITPPLVGVNGGKHLSKKEVLKRQSDALATALAKQSDVSKRTRDQERAWKDQLLDNMLRANIESVAAGSKQYVVVKRDGKPDTIKPKFVFKTFERFVRKRKRAGESTTRVKDFAKFFTNEHEQTRKPSEMKLSIRTLRKPAAGSASASASTATSNRSASKSTSSRKRTKRGGAGSSSTAAAPTTDDEDEDHHDGEDEDGDSDDDDNTDNDEDQSSDSGQDDHPPHLND